MPANRGVVYLGPGRVEVQSIDYPGVGGQAEYVLVPTPISISSNFPTNSRRFRKFAT